MKSCNSTTYNIIFSNLPKKATQDNPLYNPPIGSTQIKSCTYAPKKRIMTMSYHIVLHSFV